MNKDSFETLTPGERDVLRAALGRTNDAVAAELGLSPSTVRNQMLSARRKLGSPPKGQASLLFTAWEAAQQKMLAVEHEVPMALTAATADEHRAGGGTVQDHRTTFDYLDHPPPVPSMEVTLDQLLPLVRIVLILVTVALVLACFRYLPDLRTWANAVAGDLNPLLNEAGVHRSG